MRKKTGLAIAVSVVAVVLVFLILSGGTNQLLGPKANFIIESRDLDTTTEGLFPPDYIAYVYVTVKNTGGRAGNAVVYVKVTQGSDAWQKQQSCYLEAGESNTLTFRFSEIDFWTTHPLTYDVWLG